MTVASLADVTVVDLTTNVAGPFATQILGDLGADVIKIERPGSGDDTRGWGPPFWGHDRVSVSFLTLNRNKRSVVLDLRSQEGAEQARRLIASADVLVQNLRPSALRRLGFDEATLMRLNPRLVYCEISGFGAVGPRASEPAFDPLMQAFSGLMSITGEDGGAPSRIPVSVLDKGTGLWAVIGVLNALRLRDLTGRGSTVRTSLLETALTWQSSQLLGYLSTGRAPGRLGSSMAGIAPYQAFLARDRHLVIAAGNDRLWCKLCAVLGLAHLADDERFTTNRLRYANRAELTRLIEEALGARDADAWLVLLGAAGTPAAPINDAGQVLAEPQVEAVGMLERPDDAGPEEPWYVHTTVTPNGVRFPIRRPAPKLGADTDDVLAVETSVAS